jgi:hypothetical protein
LTQASRSLDGSQIPAASCGEPLPSPWPLRLAVLLFVLGTVHYVERDPFHQDDSVLQPIIEISFVALGTCLALGAALHYRTRITLRLPSVLLLSTLALAVACSPRSWDPWLSATRGTLVLMLSVSTVALLRTYGVRRLLYCVLNAYLFLIVFGVIVGLASPEDFPLMVQDPGQEAIRARLHLFKIHPILLADDCAICLLISVLYRGPWIRLLRLIFASCLVLTVTRASIILGLPLYLVAEFLSSANVRRGLRPISVVAVLVLLPAAIAIGLMFVYSDWWLVDQIRTSVSVIADATKDNVTLNGRTALWSTLIQSLSLDNLYGYGVNGARYYVRTMNLWAEHSHNSILETIYTSGYVGALMIVSALSIAVVRLAKAWKSPQARLLTVTLAYVVAAGMMNPSWYDASSLIAISIACSGPWEPSRPQRAPWSFPLSATAQPV